MKVKVLQILKRVLNIIDGRLINHGERVAYIVYRYMVSKGTYTDKEIQDVVTMSLVHDIGAYKTEEIDNMVEFETVSWSNHAIYGYLFLKYFSPIGDISPALLFHHNSRNAHKCLPPKLAEYANLIEIADRIDVLGVAGITNTQIIRSRLIADLHIDSLLVGEVMNSGIIFPLSDATVQSDEQFQRLLHRTDYSQEDIFSYLYMIAVTLDFRSPQTVTHTISAYAVTLLLAQLAGYDEENVTRISYSALMHDFGKIGIPSSVLEKPGRLTPEEREVIETHINIGEDILNSLVDSDMFKIALRHHEKLDGSGYAHGYKGSELSRAERLFAVADIASALCGVRSYKQAYPAEKIIDIITEMRGRLDEEMCDLVIDNIDECIEIVGRYSADIEQTYRELVDEYNLLFAQMKSRDYSSIKLKKMDRQIFK